MSGLRESNVSVSMRILGTGKPLVLIHGWGFDHQIWMSFAEMMSEGNQLFLVDFPGFGETPMMSWDAFKEALVAKLPKTFGIVGWSMGGMIATRLALELSGRVTQLINIASTPKFTADLDWPGVERHVFDGFYNQFIENPFKTRQQFMRVQLQGHHSKCSSMMQMKASQQGLQQGLDILKHWDLRTQLHSIDIPVSYFFGRLDALVPCTVMEQMKKIYPMFDYFLLDKAAHIPFLSHQQVFLSCFKECL